MLAHGYVALTNDMLKANKVAQVLIFLSGWVVAGGIFLKDEVEQQQLVYFKNKVFTITGTG
jgi:hypothetical protein